MEEAEALCDRVAIIDRGQLVALDTPRALINSLAALSSITTSAYVPLSDVQTLPHIFNVQRDGLLLRIQTHNVAMTLRAFLDLAERHQVSLNDLNIKQPSLEDVFLDRTGRTIRD